MTTRISQYLGGHIANWLRGTAMPSAPSVVYMALSTATISDVSGAVEPTGSYARQAVTYGAISRSEASGCIIANSAPIVFTGLDACVVTDFAIYDAPTGGNVLVFGKLRVPFSVSAAGSVSFAVGVHTFQYAGLASYYFGDAICNWLKGTSTPPPTSVSLIHSTTPILRSGSGITAPAGGYSSKLVTFAATQYIDRLRGVANGLATLGSDGKVPTSQLPSAITGALSYQGTWDASTNTPTLTSGTGTKGHMYKVSVAGTTTLDTYNDWSVGDFVVFNGTTWDGIDGDKSEVTSVAGRIGAIVLTVSDVSGAAPLASPAFTGSPTAPTQTQGDNSTKLATTAYVDTGLATKANTSSLGTMASQNANAVAITGGTINGVTLGNTVAFSGTDLDGGTF